MSLRIVHFADNHLGAGIDRRQQDIIDRFSEAVEKIIELKPDLVINSGDLFHMVHPANRVIALASEQLIRLGREAQIPTLIISGNHDACKQKHIGAVLSIFEGFENIYPVYRSRLERFTIGQCAISALPHCLTTDILAEELQKIEPNPTVKYNILVLHGVVKGMHEFRMADLSEQEIDRSYFAGFDYVALGHYHNYTRVQPMVYYSGSTERLSQSEAGHEKGIIEINLNKGEKSLTFHPVKSRVMLDLKPVKAKGRSAEEIMTELEKAVKDQKPEDKIIRIKLTDIPEETYRALPFDRIAELKSEAFSLDVQFEKEEKPEENLYADLNLGRLDLAFEKFLDSKTVENLDKERLKKMGLEMLHRAEGEEP
jgi:DNA repair exonuclease SbcCD nuclease subunit